MNDEKPKLLRLGDEHMVLIGQRFFGYNRTIEENGTLTAVYIAAKPEEDNYNFVYVSRPEGKLVAIATDQPTDPTRQTLEMGKCKLYREIDDTPHIEKLLAEVTPMEDPLPHFEFDDDLYDIKLRRRKSMERDDKTYFPHTKF